MDPAVYLIMKIGEKDQPMNHFMRFFSRIDDLKMKNSIFVLFMSIKALVRCIDVTKQYKIWIRM